MPVLKGDAAQHQASGAVVLDLGDLHREAERIRAAAEARAQERLDEAETHAQKLIDEADARGHSEGRERGEREGRAAGETEGRATAQAEHAERLAILATNWTSALDGWSKSRERMLRDASDDVLTLALRLADKIVMRTPRVDPTVVQDQLRSCLDLMLTPSALIVEINPADRSLVEEVLPELTRRFGEGVHARIVECAEIAPGGVRARTEHGHVDATLDRQLEVIAETLLPPTTTELAPVDSPVSIDAAPDPLTDDAGVIDDEADSSEDRVGGDESTPS